MPSASANISAKFMAQIEMSPTSEPRYSEPAAATRPMIVSISGRPAATSEPKASTRMPSVTGHEISSLLIIASRFAALKSLQSTELPVMATSTPSPLSSRSGSLRSSAARTISLVFGVAGAGLDARATVPSGEIEPGLGRDDQRDALVGLEQGDGLVDRPACPALGDRPVLGAGTTTCSAELDMPAELLLHDSRAWTESEPFASQPAPARACSTLGAKAPSPTTISSQATSTGRKWVAVQAPRRPRARAAPPRGGRGRGRGRGGRGVQCHVTSLLVVVPVVVRVVVRPVAQRQIPPRVFRVRRRPAGRHAP